MAKNDELEIALGYLNAQMDCKGYDVRMNCKLKQDFGEACKAFGTRPADEIRSHMIRLILDAKKAGGMK